LREELAAALDKALAAAPGATIYIESTGVGDPAGIIESIQPILQNGKAALGPVIVIYDAGRPLLSGKDAMLVERQLRTADVIIINKADLALPAEIQAVLQRISELNPGAETYVTSHGEADFNAMLTGMSGLNSVANTASTSDNYRSYGFQVREPLRAAALEDWLKTLPPSVIRAKGFIRLAGQPGIYEVQATRGQVTLSRFSGGNTPAMLVLISHPMRTDGLIKGLERCLTER